MMKPNKLSLMYWQLAQAVIAALFNLKASELALAMTTQPKRIQVSLSTHRAVTKSFFSVLCVLDTLVLIACDKTPEWKV